MTPDDSIVAAGSGFDESERPVALLTAHHGLMREYRAVLKETQGLRFFHRMRSNADEDAEDSEEPQESMVLGDTPMFGRVFLEKVLYEQKVPPPHADVEPRPGAEPLLKTKQGFTDALFHYPSEFAKQTAANARRPTRAVWGRYLSLARSLVLGPLVRRHARVHIKTVLTRLRGLYLAERTKLNPLTDRDGSGRGQLTRMLEDVSDFGQLHPEMSRLSRGRAEAGGIAGGFVQLGIPTSVIFGVGELLSSSYLDPIYAVAEDIFQWNIDPSELSLALILQSAGGLAAGAAILLAPGLFFIASIMAYYAKGSLFLGSRGVVVGRNTGVGLAEGDNADGLERKLFEMLEAERPKQPRSDLRIMAMYLVAGPLLGGVLMVLSRL